MEAPRYCYRHPDRETGLSCSECGRPICYECMTPAPVGLRCPEHSGKAHGIQKVQRAVSGVGSRRVNAVTLALIGINVAVAIAEFASGRSASFTNNTIFLHGSLFASLSYDGFSAPVGVAHGEWWRLVTSMFLHANFLHIAMNMYSLYYAGSILEQVIGRWRFGLLYLASGIAGSAGALVWSPNTPTLGASGAIFGILGALFVLERRGNIHSGGQIAGLIVINLVITFALSSYISVGAHVGGLIGGVLLMFALVNFRRSAVLSIASSAALVVISVAIAYLKVRNYQ
ncbi:MAG TPA: rhomboid family intramembrane serine protease [Gaiellaceae bacterium]|nr:rhomboid family intramembrane serine protease [Gaiellaceae bacterium]